MAQESIILPDQRVLVVDRGRSLSYRRSSSNLQATRIDILKGPTSGPDGDVSSDSVVGSLQRRSQSRKRDFRFVAATEPDGRHDSAAHKLVRSHVRKESSRRDAAVVHTHRRTLPNSEVDTDVIPTQEHRASLSVNHDPTWPSPQGSIMPKQISRSDFYSAIIDLFHPLGRYVRYDPDPLEACWYRVTMVEDQLLLEAMHVLVSLYMTAPTDLDAIAHINRLLKSVYEQLIIKIGQQQITDATIGAVLCLGITGYHLGDEVNWETHRRGSRYMLAHRGGIEQLDTTLQMRLYSADIFRAIDRQDTPYLSCFQELPRMLDPYRCPQKDSAMDCVRNSGMNQNLQPPFRAIISLTRQIEHAIKSGSSLDPLDIDKACICIQYNLHEVQASPSDDTLRWAAANFIRTLVRPKFPVFKGYRLVPARVRECYEESLYEDQDHKLMLWASVVNTNAALETGEGSYFLKHLKSHIRELGCHDLNDLKQILSSFLWIGCIHDPMVQDLWQSLGTVAD